MSISVTMPRELEAILGYTFNNPNHVVPALQAAGNGVSIPGSNRPNNEGNMGLAVVGDTVIHLVINNDGYLAGQSRGDMSQALQVRSSNSYLVSIGNRLGIDRFVARNPNNPNGPIAPKVMSAMVEALVGAAFLDGGLAAARTVMVSLGI